MCHECKRVVAAILPDLFHAGATSIAGRHASDKTLTVEEIEGAVHTSEAVRLLGDLAAKLNDPDRDDDLAAALGPIFVEEGRTTITMTAAAKAALYLAQLSESLASIVLQAIEVKARKQLDEDAVHFALSETAMEIRRAGDRAERRPGIGGSAISMIMTGLMQPDAGDEAPAPEFRH